MFGYFLGRFSYSVDEPINPLTKTQHSNQISSEFLVKQHTLLENRTKSTLMQENEEKNYSFERSMNSPKWVSRMREKTLYMPTKREVLRSLVLEDGFPPLSSPIGRLEEKIEKR